MHIRNWLVTGVGLFAVVALGALATRDLQSGQDVPVKFKKPPKKDETNDHAAIRKASADFAQAFDKGDAKAVASSWTAQGEYHDETGEIIRGRADIEKAFADFFKEKPKAKIEVRI